MIRIFATVIMFAGGSSSDIWQCWVPRVPVSSGDHGADPGAQPRHRRRLQGAEEGEVAEDVCQRLLSSQQESEQIVVNLTCYTVSVRRDLIWEMREEWRWLINETWHVKYNFEFSDQAIWAFYSVIDPPKHSNPRKTYQRAATNMSWWNMQMLHLDQVLHFIPLPIQQFLWLTARKSRWWFMFMNIFEVYFHNMNKQIKLL